MLFPRFTFLLSLQSGLTPSRAGRTPGPAPRSDRLIAVVAAACCFGQGAVGGARAEAPDLGHLDATRVRPLFSPTRRRPPDPSVSASATPFASIVPVVPPPALQLSGIVIGGGRTIAVVKRLSDARILSLEVGRDVDGWQVTDIQPREVTIRQGARAVTLHLTQR